MPKKFSEEEIKEREKLKAFVQECIKNGMQIKDAVEELKKVKGVNISYALAFSFEKGYLSITEYQKDLAKKRQKVEKHLELVGYSIESLKAEEGQLVIRISQEEKNLSEELVKSDFNMHLQKYLQIIGIENNKSCKFEVAYTTNEIYIKALTIEARAHLRLYKKMLKREIVWDS